MKADARRIKLLKMEGIGFSKAEILKELPIQFHVTERTVYHDFEHREKWQPRLMHVKDAKQAVLKARNRFNTIYKDASIMLTNDNPNVKLGAQKIRLEATTRWLETFPELRQIIQTGEPNKPFIIKMWRPELAKPKTT